MTVNVSFAYLKLPTFSCRCCSINAPADASICEFPKKSETRFLCVFVFGIRVVLSNFKKYNVFEPPHDKTNKMACAPSEDSDQPGQPPSLI